jgi:hypothetical protein
MSVSLVGTVPKFRLSMPRRTEKLQQYLICASFINLLIVALMGVLLRSFPFLPSFPLTYKNILHGHSHFAFGGWLMPVLLGLMLKNFPQLQQRVSYHHWRNIFIILLTSAYGMLLAFPLQGYKAVSIFFSTLSILGSFYMAVVIWKALKGQTNSVAAQFLKAGVFYMVLSSLGPFATAPLIAMEKSGTSIYYDAVYFYLHFQYNGWFLFAVLAFIYQYLERKGKDTNGKKGFWLLNLSCIPTYFLSVLWHQPPVIFNIIGGTAALLQCCALIFLLRDVRLMALKNKLVKLLVHVSIASLALKMVLQFLSAWPLVADLAYLYKNFVIAYLHLVLLGCISLFLIGWSIRSFAVAVTYTLKTGIAFFLIGFVSIEVLLIAFPLSGMLHYSIPHYNLLLLAFSILLPVSVAMLARSFFPQSFLKSRVPANTQG